MYIKRILVPTSKEITDEIIRYMQDALSQSGQNIDNKYLSLIIRGDYGMGKTQTLMYIKYLFGQLGNEKFRPYVVYIDNPGVKYGEGIAYVVNIIVKHPISGYDVGADLTNTLTAVNGDETIYGKLNFGKSEFGVTYSLGYQNFKGTKYEEKATYQLESGEKQSILRKQLDGQDKSLDHNLQLTYSLSDSNFVFQSKLSAQRDIQPDRSWAKFATYEDHSSSRSSSPAVDLYFHREVADSQYCWNIYKNQ